MCAADDTALVYSSRKDMVLAAEVLNEVVNERGLTLSVPKTKLIVAGIGLTEGNLTPLKVK